MQYKETYINTILQDISGSDNSSIIKDRENQIISFIRLTINGDNPKDHLTIRAKLGNDEGIIIYVLTDIRLIEIDIDPKEVKSSSFRLNSITNIERKLLDDGRTQTKILLPNDSFGLSYSSSDEKISDFFQKIDQSRVGRDTNE